MSFYDTLREINYEKYSLTSSYMEKEADKELRRIIRDELSKQYTKLYLNSVYGQMVYADTDSIYTKENNNMKKRFYSST